MAEEEPQGLSMSLDDLIKLKGTDRHDGDSYGKQQRRPYNNDRRGGFNQRFDGQRQFQNRQGGFQQRGGFQQPGGYQMQQQQQFRDPNDYRMSQSCFTDATGNLVFKFKSTEIVKVTPTGDITLKSDGHHNSWTLASLNDVLNPIGIRVTSPDGNVKGDWTVSDGRALVRFHDGVVLPGKGAQHATRAKQLKQAFDNPNRMMAAAAAAASNAAASQAGLLPYTGAGGFVPGHMRGGPPHGMGMGMGMMMPAQQGFPPFQPIHAHPQQQQPFQYQQRREYGQQQQQVERGQFRDQQGQQGKERNEGGPQGQRERRPSKERDAPSVFARLGDKPKKDDDWETKRLKSQGRYQPY